MNESSIASHYTHVDNGGYTFSVNETEHNTYITVTDGYYGYSTNTMNIYSEVTPENLRQISEMFLKAALAIEDKMRVAV